MRVRAPGKLVLSGAYAVLEGAPAVCAAVDRYVVADDSRPAITVTDEVRAALADSTAPFFDASALRQNNDKLGLGSSAAILVASLGARELTRDPALTSEGLRQRVLQPALLAHKKAQGGGSGVDVATCVHGGVIRFQLVPKGVDVKHVSLPEALGVRVFYSGKAASTRDLLQKIDTLHREKPNEYNQLIEDQADAAERAAQALGDAPAFVEALRDQCFALYRLGRAAGADIVSDEQLELCHLAGAEEAAALPAGAGGGDVMLFAGLTPPSQSWLSRALAFGQKPLKLSLGAPGLQALSPTT